MVVQVLYFEQIRMRNAMGGGEEHHHPFHHQDNGPGATFTNRNLYKGSVMVSPKLDTFSSLRRENRDLKEEVARLQVEIHQFLTLRIYECENYKIGCIEEDLTVFP